MYASPELYYRTVTLENERELEQRLAYRRAAAESPEQVLPRRSFAFITRMVTALRGLLNPKSTGRRNARGQRSGLRKQHPTPAS